MSIRLASALVAVLLFVATPAAAQGPSVAPGSPVSLGVAPAACPAGSSALYGPRGPGCYELIEQHHQRGALFWPGFASFLAGYALGVTFGYFNLEAANGNGVHQFGFSFIPVVGPLVAMGLDDHPEDMAFFGGMAGLQAVGITLMILSHVFPERVESQRRVAFTGTGLAGVF